MQFLNELKLKNTDIRRAFLKVPYIKLLSRQKSSKTKFSRVILLVLLTNKRKKFYDRHCV